MATVDVRTQLLAAAERLELLATRTTRGDWRLRGLLATRPEVIASAADGGTQHVADARERTGGGIAALPPHLPPPLAGGPPPPAPGAPGGAPPGGHPPAEGAPPPPP